eukprot:CFRG4332T1
MSEWREAGIFSPVSDKHNDITTVDDSNMGTATVNSIQVLIDSDSGSNTEVYTSDDDSCHLAVVENEIAFVPNTSHDAFGESSARDVTTGWLTHTGTFHDSNEDRVITKHLTLECGLEISILGVFDGHGGSMAAEFACTRSVEIVIEQLEFAERRNIELSHSVYARILYDAFLKVDEEYTSSQPLCPDGTCGLLVVVAGNDVYSSNLGDCSAFLVTYEELIDSSHGKLNRGDNNLPDDLSKGCSKSDRRKSVTKVPNMLRSSDNNDKNCKGDEDVKKIQSTTSLKGLFKAARRLTILPKPSKVSKSYIVPLTCESLTQPHNTGNLKEVERVLAAGGRIENNRVGGFLLPTRAIGDGMVKSVVHGVLSEPEVRQFSLSSGTDAFLVLGTDGLWDFTTETQAVVALNQLRKKKGLTNKEVPAMLAQRLKDVALSNRTKVNNDDVSVLVAHFPVPSRVVLENASTCEDVIAVLNSKPLTIRSPGRKRTLSEHEDSAVSAGSSVSDHETSLECSGISFSVATKCR